MGIDEGAASVQRPPSLALKAKRNRPIKHKKQLKREET